MIVASDVILYIKHFNSREQLLKLKRIIDQFHGIINTIPGQESPKILVVDYDPDKITGPAIIQRLKLLGIQANLIGM